MASQKSPNTQPHRARSASASPLPDLPAVVEKENLALASSTSSQRSASGAQVTQLSSDGSAPAGNDAHQTTPRNKHYKNNTGAVPTLPEPPTDIFEEGVGEPNQGVESSAADQDNLPSLLTSMSLVEVWVSLSFVPAFIIDDFARGTCENLSISRQHRCRAAMAILLRRCCWPNKAHRCSSDTRIPVW
jgi:hypothetical protein